MWFFLSCRPFVVNATFSTGWVFQKKLGHPKRPVENVALTMKGLQERKTTIEWDDGGKMGNKNKLIHSFYRSLNIVKNMYLTALKGATPVK